MSALFAGRVADTPGRPPGTQHPRLVAAARALFVLAAIGVAYHYSLLTLVRSLALDTPLAYLGLVPFLAVALAIVSGRRWRWEPDIHDRYVDYIVGIPLLFIALVITVVLPAMVSSFYWRWRLDLLALPVFVAGAVTIVFGIRTTVRMRTAIAFLFLAWPLPYTLLLSGWLQASTDATIHALRGLLGVIPVAHPVDAGDGSLFWIPYRDGGFKVSVAAACAGVNGSLGFLLVGSAAAAVVRGGVGRKLLWLGNGVVVTMALNLVRIVAIFGAGHALGPRFALDALHPVIGLVTFNLGVGASLLVLPWFGLRLDAPSGPRPRAASAVWGGTPAPAGTLPAQTRPPCHRAARFPSSAPPRPSASSWRQVLSPVARMPDSVSSSRSRGTWASHVLESGAPLSRGSMDGRSAKPTAIHGCSSTSGGTRPGSATRICPRQPLRGSSSPRRRTSPSSSTST